jgi:hypothetical protein
VDKLGDRKDTGGAPSSPGPDILFPELTFSLSDHKKALLFCLRFRVGHRIQDCKKETKFRKICLLAVLFLLTN